MDFYTSIHHYYDAIFPLQTAQIDFIKQYIQEGNASILDVGCATGNLAVDRNRIYSN